MTEASDTQREPQANTAADTESDAIQDLDVTGDAAADIVGGSYEAAVITTGQKQGQYKH